MMALSESSKSNSSEMPAYRNACTIWSEKGIRSIDSGEVIGRTDMSDEEITQGMSGLENYLVLILRELTQNAQTI
jgi:hypothetical protein